MPHKNTPFSQQEISLEDLLKVKRHERPSAESWEQFDLQLKQRTLRALVHHRPSLKERLLALAPSRSRAWLLGLSGATAALALAMSSTLAEESTHSVGGVSGKEMAAVPSSEHISAESPLKIPTATNRTPAIAQLASTAVSNADFTVDVIAANTANEAPRQFTTDFKPDVLLAREIDPNAYAVDIFSANIATLYSQFPVIGM